MRANLAVGRICRALNEKGLDEDTVIIHMLHRAPTAVGATPLEELFDLEADPHEERNLVADASHTTILAKLRARCDSYRQTLQ
jgi:arylsulfatase A-like enzyme